MNLFVKVLLDHGPKSLFVLKSFEVNHLIVSFQRKSRANLSNWQVVTLRKFSAKRAIASEDLDFNVVSIYSIKFSWISRVNIMQMNALTALTELSVSSRPFTSLFHILFEVFTPVFARNIKVDYNVVFRNLDIMSFRSVEIGQFCRHVFPFLCRGFLCASILSWAILALLIKYRFSRIEFNQLRFMYVFLFRFVRVENISTETAISVTQLRTFDFVFEVPKIVFEFFFEDSLREWIWDICLLTICAIHLPCRLKCGSIFFDKNMIRIYHEVIEVIRRSQHHGRYVIVISPRIAQIYFFAVIRDCSEFETNLLSDCFVLFRV